MLLVDNTLLNLHNSSLWSFVTRLHYYSMDEKVHCLEALWNVWGSGGLAYLAMLFLGLKVNLELSK